MHGCMVCLVGYLRLYFFSGVSDCYGQRYCCCAPDVFSHQSCIMTRTTVLKATWYGLGRPSVHIRWNGWAEPPNTVLCYDVRSRRWLKMDFQMQFSARSRRWPIVDFQMQFSARSRRRRRRWSTHNGFPDTLSARSKRRWPTLDFLMQFSARSRRRRRPILPLSQLTTIADPQTCS